MIYSASRRGVIGVGTTIYTYSNYLHCWLYMVQRHQANIIIFIAKWMPRRWSLEVYRVLSHSYHLQTLEFLGICFEICVKRVVGVFAFSIFLAMALWTSWPATFVFNLSDEFGVSLSWDMKWAIIGVASDHKMNDISRPWCSGSGMISFLLLPLASLQLYQWYNNTFFVQWARSCCVCGSRPTAK